MKISLNYCCLECGGLIKWWSALYGTGLCKSCANKGERNRNWVGGKPLCKSCGKILSSYDCKYCIKCFNKKELNNNWKGGKPHCIDCNKKLSRYNAKRCRDCHKKISFGKNAPRFINGSCIYFFKCLKCNVAISKQSVYNTRLCFSCFSKTRIGDKNPAWAGGISKMPYAFNFNNNLKLKIRTRDNFTCQNCNLKEKNHYRGNKKINLIIHHIDYNKENCNENNLITVCNRCNIIANGNKELDRDYWYAYYTYKTENI